MPTANKVKFGLKNAHYALLTPGEAGAVSYATPVRIPGAVTLSLEPQGETSEFYADDMVYYATAANSGYQGDLEIAIVPDSFAQDVLKEALDETAKVLIENAQAEGASFALLFEFSGDQRAVRHVLYSCTAARPSVSGSTTTNTKEPTTSTLTLTAVSLANGLVKAKTTADTPDETYSGWYQSVWMPTAAEPGA